MKRALLVVAILCAVAGPTLAQAGQAAPLTTAEVRKKVEDFTRRLYALGATYRVTAAEPKEAKLPGFYEIAVEVGFQDSTDQALMYVSKDGRHIIRGEVFEAAVDPYAATRAQITIDGRPFKGPATASVVVVEYADFQCPSCKQLYDVLKQVVPLYPQVKFVFKDFPLDQIHPWARNAANAGYCAQQQNPAAFWKLHDRLFESQASITAENHWQKLQDFATEAGLDTARFRMCLTAPETKAAIDASISEAIKLRIANTPTMFINGRRMIGANREQLEQILQFELEAAKPPAQPAGPRP